MRYFSIFAVEYLVYIKRELFGIYFEGNIQNECQNAKNNMQRVAMRYIFTFNNASLKKRILLVHAWVTMKSLFATQSTRCQNKMG